MDWEKQRETLVSLASTPAEIWTDTFRIQVSSIPAWVKLLTEEKLFSVYSI
jgi:hypothetical protein